MTDFSKHKGPALLVLVALFYKNRMLLIKRAIPPYRGKWALPGGFVEANESLEEAGVRELREETGIEMNTSELTLLSLVSVKHMNEVYVVFRAMTDSIRYGRLLAGEEAEQVRWFDEGEFPTESYWLPPLSKATQAVFNDLLHARTKFYVGDATDRSYNNKIYELVSGRVPAGVNRRGES